MKDVILLVSYFAVLFTWNWIVWAFIFPITAVLGTVSLVCFSLSLPKLFLLYRENTAHGT
eukprot:m.172039 g.172039  ORF g.172039 m.172039 type:complete len:60 (+) comp14827_c0_seq1:1418-1597(+)